MWESSEEIDVEVVATDSGDTEDRKPLRKKAKSEKKEKPEKKNSKATRHELRFEGMDPQLW